MTREEAIEIIKDLIDTYVVCHGEEDMVAVSLDNVDVEALDMAIEALKNQPRFIIHSDGTIEQIIEICEDCISRKAVLDMVEDMTDQFGNKHRVVTEGMISLLSPVTPKPKTDVLDKIKTEIKEELRFCPLTEGLERALEIIDKYKAESEG